jgi:hypothetical protein
MPLTAMVVSPDGTTVIRAQSIFRSIQLPASEIAVFVWMNWCGPTGSDYEFVLSLPSADSKVERRVPMSGLPGCVDPLTGTTASIEAGS